MLLASQVEPAHDFLSAGALRSVRGLAWVFARLPQPLQQRMLERWLDGQPEPARRRSRATRALARCLRVGPGLAGVAFLLLADRYTGLASIGLCLCGIAGLERFFVHSALAMRFAGHGPRVCPHTAAAALLCDCTGPMASLHLTRGQWLALAIMLDPRQRAARERQWQATWRRRVPTSTQPGRRLRF